MTHIMNPHARKRLWLALIATIAIAAVVCAIIAVASQNRAHLGDNEVARVDGRTIGTAELSAIAGAAGISLTSTGQVRRAVAAAERFIALEQLAKRHGIIDDISYRATLSRLAQTNAQRKQDAASGKAVYGVAQYTPQTYYIALQSSIQTTLISKLVRSGTISTSTAQLHRYYAKHASEYARGTDNIQLTVLRYSGDARGQSAAAAALEALQSGTPLSTVESTGSSTPRIESLHVDQRTAGDLSKYHSSELSTAQTLQAGASAMVADDISAEPLVLVCGSRTAGSMQPFATVKNETRSRYEHAALERLLTRQLTHADININSNLASFVRA